MAYRNTVAIIGAATKLGALIAKGIAANYRLLLMDSEQAGLVSLQKEIQAVDKYAEVDVLHCCKNASWEADVIIVANEGEDLDDLAVKMEDVSTCKTVLHFISREASIDKLQQLLPYAKVVSILSTQPFTEATVDAFIRGTDTEALDRAKTIVAAMARTRHLS